MADLSEHFGRVGEFWLGLFGLLLLMMMMHPAMRRRAIGAGRAIGKYCLMLHATLRRKSRFYADWVSAFQILFYARNNLFLIVLPLTAFDYLTGWHRAFMLERFNLYPDFAAIGENDFYGQLTATVLSAANALGLLRLVGYTLFCWLAFRVAAGDSYQSAATFRPYRRLIGLFLRIYGAELFASATTPYVIIFGESIVGDVTTLTFITGALVFSMFFFLLGGRLINGRFNGAIRKSAFSAIIGFLLLTHALQWLDFAFSRAAKSQNVFLSTAEYHAGNFTYTLLWNIALVAFAVRLSGPPRMAREPPLHQPANAV